MVGRPTRRSASGLETLLEVREWSGGLPEDWEWSGGLSRGPEVVVRPSRRSGNGQEAFLEVR